MCGGCGGRVWGSVVAGYMGDVVVGCVEGVVAG